MSLENSIVEKISATLERPPRLKQWSEKDSDQQYAEQFVKPAAKLLSEDHHTSQEQ